MRKEQKMTLSPNPWDKVQVHNGKLVGTLTDELALASLPDTNSRSVFDPFKKRKNYLKNKTK